MNSLRLCPALDKTSYSSKQAVPVSLILSLWPYGKALTRLMPQSRPNHEESGFRPNEMFERLGIEADLANYSQLAA